MKKIAIAVVLSLIFGFACAQKESLTQIPKDLTVYDLEGNPKTLGEIITHDGVVVLDFWATWCRPCIMELEKLTEVYPEWKEETNVKIVLISIDSPNKISKIKEMAAKNKWQYELYIDSDNLTKKQMGITQIPNVYISDNKGNVLHHELGYSNHGVKVMHKIITKNSK